ncbi:MAG: DUF2914 domain-containing protein [Nitrospirae bacterium]|nr:DUF2914 domain-containing protein [Nitrospirota bacterium]
MKKRGFPSATALCALAIFYSGSFAVAAGLEVREAVVALGVENRQPTGSGTSFPADVGRLSAFTRIESVEERTTVKHVWYHGDRKMFEMVLEVGPKSWRTWSSKRILPEWTGEWRVEVLSPDGTLMKKLVFSIEPAGGRE